MLDVLKKIWAQINFAYVILLILSFVWIGFVLYPTFKDRQKIETEDFGSGIQNHLVWSVKNECYFAKPENLTNVKLIRVVDCDKK
jgi:predicted metal-dependent phosphotriesterase family hydrolase